MAKAAPISLPLSVSSEVNTQLEIFLEDPSGGRGVLVSSSVFIQQLYAWIILFFLLYSKPVSLNFGGGGGRHQDSFENLM